MGKIRESKVPDLISGLRFCTLSSGSDHAKQTCFITGINVGFSFLYFCCKRAMKRYIASSDDELRKQSKFKQPSELQNNRSGRSIDMAFSRNENAVAVVNSQIDGQYAFE